MAIRFTAVGRYFHVYANGAHVSQHTTEREAAEASANLIAADPGAQVRYVHEYEVTVDQTDTVVEPPPVEEPPPAEEPPPVDQPPPDPVEVPPVAVVTDPELLAGLLPFAETWDRNWNYGGHAVDARFDGNYGSWDYADNVYEPWLFDRATCGFRLYQMTGDDRWRMKFFSDFVWYHSHIDAAGIFTPKGSGDTKYGYVTPFVIYADQTGDRSFDSIAQRIYDAWLAEWPNVFNPSALFWTEREMAFAMEAALGWYYLTGAGLDRCVALLDHWDQACGSEPVPHVTYTQHEGGGPGGTAPTNPTNSPWMSALYFQAARALYALTGYTRILDQVSRYFDWLDINGLYDGSLAHPEFTGLTFPRYLTGELIGDAGYDEGNMGHALDVAGLVKFAVEAKQILGLDTARAEQRLAELKVTAMRDFQNWTREAAYLPMYRVSPPRKANWMIRGLYELSR